MMVGPGYSRLSARVFCLPYAGGSSRSYLHWQRIGGDIEVVALDYPGRLIRPEETAPETVTGLADHLFEEIVESLCLPFAFVGTSLGALVAFELSRRAENAGLRPSVLVICSSAAPGRGLSRGLLSGMTDEAFAEALFVRYGSNISPVLADPATQEVFLPIMRRDIATYESYGRELVAPVDTDIVAVRGESDKAVTLLDVAKWNDFTSGSMQVMTVPGNHFFIESNPGLILGELRLRLLNASATKRY